MYNIAVLIHEDMQKGELIVYKAVKRFYLIKDKQDITPETPHFDWIGECNLFKSFRNELELHWRVCILNGRYGVVDMLTGETVLDCIYSSVGVTSSKQFGTYLFLERQDKETNEQFCSIFTVSDRKILFEVQCEAMVEVEARICENRFLIRRNNKWGLYNIKTQKLHKECEFTLRQLEDWLQDNAL